MIQFKVINNSQLEIDEKILLVPEFKLLLDRYGDKGKRFLLATYLFCDYQSPFSDMLEQERFDLVKRICDIVELTEEEDRDFAEALKWYDKLNETAFNRSLKSIDGMIDKINTLIQNTTPELRIERDTRTGKEYVIDTTKHIKDLMRDLDVVYEKREKLELRLNKKAIDSKARGNAQESILSKGAITGSKRYDS